MVYSLDAAAVLSKPLQISRAAGAMFTVEVTCLIMYLIGVRIHIIRWCCFILAICVEVREAFGVVPQQPANPSCCLCVGDFLRALRIVTAALETRSMHLCAGVCVFWPSPSTVMVPFQYAGSSAFQSMKNWSRSLLCVRMCTCSKNTNIR